MWVWKRGKGGRKKELKWIYRLNNWVFALFMYITTDRLVTFSVFNSAFSIWKLSSPHYKQTKNYKTIRSRVALSVPLLRASLQWNCFLHHLGWAKDWGGGGRESNMTNETAVRMIEWEREINWARVKRWERLTIETRKVMQLSNLRLTGMWGL